MKILILGSKGMLGQELVKTFNNLNPVLWDRREIDIINQKEVQEKISRLKPEIIINAAGYTNVDNAEVEEDLARQVNGDAVEYLSLAASDVGAVFVHYSTDYVFKGDRKEGYSEDEEPAPINSYGHSKLLGERYLQKNCQKFYLIRSSRLFGRAGISFSAKKSFVDKILELAQEKSGFGQDRKEINLVDDELSCPTYALDLANSTKEIILSQKPFGIYHLVNTGACTWYEFGQKILETSHALDSFKIVPCSSVQFKRLAPRPRYSILLNTKLSQLRPWPEALKEYLGERFLPKTKK